MPTAPDEPRRTGLPRAVYLFAALSCGLVIGRYAPDLPAAVWFAAACSVLVVAALARGRTCIAALSGACILFGSGWYVTRINDGPPRSLAGLLSAGERLVTVTGTILESPLRVPEDPDPLARPAIEIDPAWAWRLRVDGIDGGAGLRPARGILRVRSADPRAGAGDRVRITGIGRPVPPPVNPGEGDRRLVAAQDGLSGYLRAPRAELIERLPEPTGLIARFSAVRLRWVAALHDRVRALLDVDAGGEPSGHGALLTALLLGEEAPALRDVRSAFTRLGLAHVLAISGFHMAVLAGVALLVLRLGGDGGRLEPLIVAGAVLAYLAILPVSAPVWRSGLMVLALLAADAAGRRYDRLAVLAWTAVILLIWRPMDLWSIGFQLSFGLLAVLIRFAPAFHASLWGGRLRGLRRGPPEGVGAGAREGFRRLVSANLLCWGVSMPTIAYHTGQVSLLAVIAGVVVVPLITVLLAAAYAGIAVGLVIPAAGGAMVATLSLLAGLMVWTVRGLDGLPWESARLAPVSLAWTVAATAVVLLCCNRKRRAVAWIGVLAVAGWLALEQRVAGRLPRGVAARIDTLAVGDGTCHVVRAEGSGKEGGERGAILWDCGSTTPGVGRVTIPRAVFALGLSRIEAAVITHPDLDHYSGLLDAAAPLGIRTVYVGECFTEQAASRPTGPEALVMHELALRGVAVRVLAAGDSVQVGDTRIDILGPPPGARWVKPNDRSLVGRLGIGAASILFTGDIETRAMDWLVAAEPGLTATAVEAPHHGSAKPAAYPFVASLDPRIVIQSTGPDRADDPRWDGVRTGRHWLTTATDGAITTEIGRDGSVRSVGFRR
ncbi:MAG: ComEC/Rec2 family competence protein [Phycisphaerales bacterium]|nr:ComEC/Rec2 family competence protein [Phycisphaerales bacterium]